MFFVLFLTVFAIKMRAEPPAEVRRTMCDGYRAKNSKIRANVLPRLNYARTQGTGAASLHPSGLVCAYPSHGCLPALPHRWHALNSEPDMHPVRGRASRCAAQHATSSPPFHPIRRPEKQLVCWRRRQSRLHRRRWRCRCGGIGAAAVELFDNSGRR